MSCNTKTFCSFVVMKVTGTREAFLRMLSQRGVYRQLDVSRSTANNWKRALLGDDLNNIPTLDKMEELLNKFGAFVQTEKVWQLPELKTTVMFTEIKNVIVSAASSGSVRYNAETFVSYHDGTYWRHAGIANLKKENDILKADIKLFKEFPFEAKYPKIALKDDYLHSILLIDSALYAEAGIKPLGFKEYKRVVH
jgi:hypothetical protein